MRFGLNILVPRQFVDLEEHMNAIWIVTVLVIIDALMEHFDHHAHALARVPDKGTYGLMAVY
jgi:hypothetical protein